MPVSSWEQGPGFSYPHQPHVGAGSVCFFIGAGARFLTSASATCRRRCLFLHGSRGPGFSSASVTCRSRGCLFLHGSRGPGFSYLHQPHVGAGGVCFFMGAEGQVSHICISHM